MAFSSFADFIEMSGHGIFVWPAYGITALMVIYLLLAPVRRSRRLMAVQRGQLRREQALEERCP